MVRAKKMGRPALQPTEGKRSKINVRVSVETREALEKEAAAGKEKLSRLIERALNQRAKFKDLVDAKYGPPNVAALAFAVSQIAWEMQMLTRRDWNRDAFTFTTVRLAIQHFLEQLQAELLPGKKPETPPSIEQSVEFVPAEYREYMKSPQGVAVTRASFVYNSIKGTTGGKGAQDLEYPSVRKALGIVDQKEDRK